MYPGLGNCSGFHLSGACRVRVKISLSHHLASVYLHDKRTVRLCETFKRNMHSVNSSVACVSHC